MTQERSVSPEPEPQPPAVPDSALQRLECLVGRWEMTGRPLDSAEDNITGWTTFAWRPGEGTPVTDGSAYDATMIRVL